MDDVIVRLMDMPTTVYGTTILDNDSDFNMYINAKLSNAMRIKVYEHEMNHIVKNHFYDDEKGIEEKERML